MEGLKMNASSHTRPGKHTDKPTIALLGEFSAGKSTLANVLLGETKSRVRVTATQFPPIWYVHGTGMPVHVAPDGTETDMPDGAIEDMSLQDTRVVRVPLQAGILRHFSLLDMPGSSDPNMSPDIWDALLPMASIVMWCTPATQAWRQSEASIWDRVPDQVKRRSLLLLTRMAKLVTAGDRSKVISRVERETAGQFRSVLPVSLLDALGPADRQDASGMPQVIAALKGILTGSPEPEHAPIARSTGDVPAQGRPATRIVPRRVSARQVTRRSLAGDGPGREGTGHE